MQKSIQQQLDLEYDRCTRVHCKDGVSDLNTWVTVCSQLIGFDNMSDAEKEIADTYFADTSANLVEQTLDLISCGHDPLGTIYCQIKSARDRRHRGQTLTPEAVVSAMFDWVDRAHQDVRRIVDPGAGTGRYILAGLKRMPQATGIAVEMDPLLAFALRANARVLGVSDRLEIAVCDYREFELCPVDGRTLFIGNPPYVRHHDISPQWKTWYSNRLKAMGHAASQLAGLHLYFFLKTALLAAPGDVGCFITAAEWLDVNYGRSLRELLLNELGGRAIHLMSANVPVFEDAMVSACITGFECGHPSRSLRFNNVDSVNCPDRLFGGRDVPRETARLATRWTALMSEPSNATGDGFVELGSLFRISRGQVTGNNRVWVTSANEFDLPPRFMFPAITAATDITKTRGCRIDDLSQLRLVIDLPADLNALPDHEQQVIQRFLDWARSLGADKGYIASHRKPWWRVNLKSPPPVVMTYRGRRPPVFAVNGAGARLINVAHGLYPLAPLKAEAIEKLVGWLNCNVSQNLGRTYAGGLTKFEPSEAMKIKVPSFDMFDMDAVGLQ